MRALEPVIADQADVDWEDWADPANNSPSAIRWKLLISRERSPSGGLVTRHALRCIGPEPLVFIFTFPRDRFEDIDYHLDP
ncbi:MAG: hypothetical protein F4060_14455 [Holophagales bacterium]|nr:hypothetical protein [Holophagales bacterium]MYG29297.1 hypothetical protein [Holophagales bacterium]MYI81133.1 hypothetical protein [Holophagales bacterium]